MAMRTSTTEVKDWRKDCEDAVEDNDNIRSDSDSANTRQVIQVRFD
jgi:hypothetical protein